MSDVKIVIAGFGGQGVLFIGKILAYAAMMSEKKVSWLPSYGPEMRGGSANCHIVISDSDIGTPIVTEADILIVLSLPALDKFESIVKRDGIIFADKAVMDYGERKSDTKIKYINARQTAREIENDSLSNMVMLGAVLAETGILALEQVELAIRNNIPKSKQELINKDIKAVLAGYEQIKAVD